MIEGLTIIVVIYLIIKAIGWFAGAVGSYYSIVMKPVIGVISIVTFVWVLIAFIKAYYEVLTNKSWGKVKENSKEPAYLTYFAYQGFRDYVAIIKRAWNLSVGWILKTSGITFVAQFALGLLAIPTIALTLPLFIAALVGVIISLVPFAVFSLIHTIIIVISLVFTLLIALFLNIIERVSMLWRRLVYVCPHSGCYKRVSLPIFVCPNCGAWHKRLIPGIFGVFRRRCQCGTLLPASSLSGRKRLDMICPNSDCNKQLHTSIGSAPSFHYAVLGEPSSGKTSYLYSLIFSMLNINKYDWFSIKDNNSKSIYKLFSADYLKGIPPLKTVQKLPDSLILESSPKVGSGLFYFYDPAGEYFLSDAETINQGEYQQYLDGMFFVIDPFSVPSIRSKCTQNELIQAGAAAGEFQSVYERLINYMRATYNDKLLQRIPVSVIITKADLIHANPKFKSPIFGYDETQLVEWLQQNGFEQVITAFNTYFNRERVKYYAVSAFGRSPEQSVERPFRPANVMTPFSWLLSNNSINPETGSMAVLKAKSEFVGNALGFVTASLLFYFTFNLAFNHISLPSLGSIDYSNSVSVVGTSIVNLMDKTMALVSQKNVIMNTNPDYASFPLQKEATLIIIKPTRFNLKGARTFNENHLLSDKFLIVSNADSLAFDMDNVELGEQIKGVNDTYKINTSFTLNPGEYHVYYLPYSFRVASDLRINKKNREKNDLWQITLSTKASDKNVHNYLMVSDFDQAISVMEKHWLIANMENNQFFLKQAFLRRKSEQRPVLYAVFAKLVEDNLQTKTVAFTFNSDLNKIVKYRTTNNAAIDLDWSKTTD